MDTTTETTYTPSPAELAAVEWMQRNGAPKDVQFVARPSLYPTGSYINHWIVFSKDGKSEKLDARGTVSWPWVSMCDLDHAGLLTKQP